MMKRLTFLFTLLMMFLSARYVNAQVALEDYGMLPIITSSEMLSSPYSDEEEGTDLNALLDKNASTFWHTDWHDKVPGNFHYLDINFAEPISGDFILYMMRRDSDQDHPTKIAVDGSVDGKKWNLVDTIYLAFNGSGKEELSAIWTINEPVNHLRLTVHETKPSFRKFWHAAELQIYGGDSQAFIAYIMSNILTKYDAYLPGWGGSFDFGTEPGQFTNVEAWEKFQEELIFTKSYLDGEVTEEFTLEQAKALAASMDALYQAILDSEVPQLPISDGYYRIAAAMEYTNTTPVVDENGEPVIDPETGEQAVETTHPTMAMYTDGNNLNWKPLDETLCPFLFRIDYNSETRNYKFYSCANDGRLDTVAKSTQVIMDNTLDDLTTEIVLNLERQEESGRKIYSISRADQNSDFAMLHQGGHASGAGKSGTVVGWEKCGGSEWYLIPVEEAEALSLIEAWAPMRDRDEMLRKVNKMKSDGKIALQIAEDINVKVDFESPLITDYNQFSSPNTTTDEQKVPGTEEAITIPEVYQFLLDGDPATYWHSRWEDNEQPAGTHYLQVELTEPEAVTSVAIVFTRRASAVNDHITEWGVYGTNEADAEKSACVDLGVLNTPFTSKSETVTSSALETRGYRYLRFYINNTVGDEITSTRGYGHVSEFQMYPASDVANPNSQMAMMGQVYTDLQNAIEAIPTEEADITVDHYNTLKAAYDAFMAKYVDPRPLRAAIVAAEDVTKVCVTGTLPGFWQEGATGDLETLIASAKTYDASGVYDKEESKSIIANLQAEENKIFTKAITVSTDKWYYIHLASEEMYDLQKWNKEGLTDETSGLGNLFGQYVSAATFEDPEGDGPDQIITPLDGEDVRENTRMHFVPKTESDGSMFRFIAVGDTAFVIQNKATGLYINCSSTESRNVSFSLNPTAFQPRAVGLGQIIFHGASVVGTEHKNLHAQRDQHRLVAWESNTRGSNSAFFVEEAEDVDFSSLNNTFVRSVRPGQIYSQCFPVSVSTDDGMYAVAGTYTTDEGKHFVGLKQLSSALPGQPFLYINGLPENYTEPADGEEPVMVDAYFTAGNEVVGSPNNQDANGLEGTFESIYVDKGTVVFVRNEAEGADGADGTDCTRKVLANSAFLKFGTTTIEPGTADLEIEILGEITEVSIQNVLDNVSKSGDVYDLNGRLVRSRATLKDVKALGRGIYILNGVRILVK